MDHRQFRLIVHKMGELSIDSLEFEPLHSGRVWKVSATFNSGRISLDSSGDALFPSHIHVRFYHGKSVFKPFIDSTITMPYGVLSLFSPSWRCWRKLCKKLERIAKEKERLKRSIEEENKRLKIEESIIDFFPDILEKELLGDDKDNK